MYSRNIGKIFLEQDQETLLTSTIGIIGVGGVGGYVAEYLCRIGCKKLILFDGDNFNSTNLNRQLFATTETLNKNKAIETKEALQKINSNSTIEAYNRFADNDNFCLYKLSECNLIFSCGVPYETNPMSMKQLFFNLIFIKHIPVVDGGITEDGIACASIITGKDLNYFNYIFDNYIINQKKNIDQLTSVSSLSYLVALAAALEVNLGIKFLCNKNCILDKEIQYDCLHDYCFK